MFAGYFACGKGVMEERNLKRELNYHSYIDMEYGNDVEKIDYECLISLLNEVLDRLDKLENDSG
jgi:hypothetical protein